MSDVIIENGIRYQIQGGKVVSATKVEEPVELVLGDRVEAEGRLGKIVLTADSQYGPIAAVLFDDESRETYTLDMLKKSEVEKPDFTGPVEELSWEFDSYEGTIAETLEEIELKASAARELNLRAAALSTDSKLPIDQKIKLDRIKIVTGTDLQDLNDQQRLLQEGVQYVSNLPRYEEMEVEAGGPTNSDLAWLDEIEITEEPTTEERRAYFTNIASTMVSSFSHADLNDAAFVDNMLGFQRSYMPELQVDSNLAEFRAAFEMAKQARLEEPIQKEAAADSLDDWDATALYL